MKISPLLLLCIGLALGGLAFGSCQGARASEMALRLQAALASRDSSAARWTVERHALTAVAQRLRGDSATLAIRQQHTHRMAADSIGKLLASIDDTVARAIAQQATRVVYVEVEGCQDALQNCEQRATNAEQRAAGDSVILAQTVILLKQTGEAWRQAERKAQPSFFRDIWRSRAVTFPLIAVSVILALRGR